MSSAPIGRFLPLTILTAPDSSKLILEDIRRSYGEIPNLMAVFANSPAVLEGYRVLENAWHNGSFPPRERQLILVAASVENRCRYCIAAHSTILTTLRAPVEIIFATRHSITLPDVKLNSVVTLARELVRGRGHVNEHAIRNFIAAGYRKKQVMELLIGIALQTISNYLDHLSPISVDQVFAEESK